MANPQTENGHIDIANEIAEALAKTQLNGYESRYLWVLWRKTYGWHKKIDVISNSQFVEATDLKKQHVWRTEQRLIARKIVTKNGYNLGFNKDYSQWLELPKMGTHKKVTKIGIGVTNSGIKVTKIGGHKRNYTKETNTKETVIDPLNEILGHFKAVNPTYERLYRIIPERAALQRLVQKFGPEKVTRMIDALPGIITQKYAPSITTPCQLERRLGDLLVFMKRQTTPALETKKNLIV